MTRWALLWRRMTRVFDVDAVPVAVVDDMAPDPDGWSAGYVDTAGTGYRTVARRLPLLIATSIRLAAEASKPRTVALLAVQTASSLAGAFSLYATTDVLAPLFGAGATPDRIRAALPSMLVVLAMTASRSLCDAVAKAFAQQLGPMTTPPVTCRRPASSRRRRTSRRSSPRMWCSPTRGRRRRRSRVSRCG